jgi:hypothetical protein
MLKGKLGERKSAGIKALWKKERKRITMERGKCFKLELWG